ncbi:SDR family NAD(P)-dependent oxidoreductase [uncultured Microbacterium sp.]|uniref:SDR family NAD(P)-dependent oxidoreductase n=1 Tax=uncultured Microbacterium sp. TaxID=191216 RepID=UPI0035CA5FDD
MNAGVLTGRTALVTGAVGALGRAISRRFAEEGARVVVADLSEAATTDYAGELAEATGADVFAVAMDVADEAAVEDAADRVSDAFGLCDAIVVNAGVLALGPSLELTRRQWDLALRVNLTGAFTTASVFGRRLARQGRSGTITFSSSLFGVRGGRGNAAYSASKFGVIGLAQSMAADLAGQGIRVNCVCPGQIDTAMLDDLFQARSVEAGTTAAEERRLFEARIPLGRLGTADEVARAFVYLSSDASAYMTGQHLIIDGGWQVG